MRDPTPAQLIEFYRSTRRDVLLSWFVAFVEIGEDNNLYVTTKRYDDPSSLILVVITPEGEVSYD
ncbi:MAG: hypothetical protein Q6M04_03270 [Thermostichus sp. BF3_bins_97]